MAETAQELVDLPEYRYEPVESNGVIRLLTLYPGKNTDRLEGTLEAVKIDSAPHYEAISYVWADAGPPDTAYKILLHGDDASKGMLTLRGGSIFAALHRVRLRNRPRRIWADQCCINQNDAVERGQQVQYMNKIYQNAMHVLVWLGLDFGGEAASAFDLVDDLDEAFWERPVNGMAPGISAVELEKHIEENHHSVQSLTNRTWFKRGWIVQEIGTSTPATLFWGSTSIEWNQLARVCERLKRHHECRSALGISTSDISFLFRRFIEPDEKTHHANRFNFVYELQRARHLNFSDDRDRVFAFLGHFSVASLHPLSCGPVSITADYTKNVEETYIDVAKQILLQCPATACISNANDNTSLKYRQRGHSLPSWVPDWRTSGGIILAEPICPHRAHGDSVQKLEIIDQEHPLLRIRGVAIDSIELHSEPLHPKDFYIRETSNQSYTKIEQLWHEVCGMGASNLNDRYVDGGQTAFFAFMQTLSNGCVQSAGHEGIAYHDIPHRVWLQKAARYIVETLGPSDNLSEEVMMAGEGAEHESGHEKWSRWATSAAEGRIFAKTRAGYFVLGPAAMEPGDVVCVLFGCKVPFCLRPTGKYYLLVGECYVHGLMNGEAIEMLSQRKLQEKTFGIV
ncbi:HET-domain-containing protein [Bimuria novae-zelandiae CBS 107.79]|uniref:HET-domain-containing protein n=1 Tax=Bimuria novae-zelandiae CBS 107.79 TaxID=1447943 RepID=A0A6A5UJZ6_9PLEO|nr:HET-domain-containing protein [Bimuria novae-zelandiae CBS 107.79]